MFLCNVRIYSHGSERYIKEWLVCQAGNISRYGAVGGIQKKRKNASIPINIRKIELPPSLNLKKQGLIIPAVIF